MGVLGHAKNLITSSFLILFMYVTSISLTFYNKWMSKRFHFPLSVTMVHFVVVLLLATCVREIYELRYRKPRIVLDWKTYLRKCFPSAVSGSLDIGLSNWSIMLSTVSLYTMAKSSTIIFIVLFSVLLGLEKMDRYLFSVMVLIFAGLFLFTMSSAQFNFYGFAMALAASVLSGVRWTTTQLIMQKKNLGLHNPFDVIYHIQPVMALSMVFLAFSMEGAGIASSELLFHAPSLHVAITSLIIILIGAFLAFLLTVAEYLLVQNTSSITLSVAAIFKEICTLTIAAEFGGDKWSALNFVGLVVCMSGIALHVTIKIYRETHVAERTRDEESMASLISAETEEEGM